MIPQQSPIYHWTVSLIVVGWLLLAFPKEDAWEVISACLIFSVMFGHTTMAATWAAFGPLPWYWRIPLSLGWVALIVAGLAVQLSIYGGPFEFALIMAACLFGQWLALQLPLWGLVLGYGLEIKHQEREAYEPASLQFGIRQLMIFTALVAVVLALGRVIVAALGASDDSAGGMPTDLLFLACAAVVLTLPLVLAAFLPRWSVAAVIIVCLLMVAVTVGEAKLTSTVQGMAGVGWDALILLNSFSYAWIILFVTAVRLSGYQLTTAKTKSAATA